ncbi:MAG TPA: YbgC/FadM family acyl-CoA thioesterase [Ottowia sp.]|nr:YbgC/FadM family acyl-CoA thioesterase [Burkholderiales bacterium]HNE60618.1 YbgC/FadM family acyl-CoA thioesterase [Ottowia sp.]HNN32870.1 YbgC/FadM family acyl-CoA thioesterase [Ottowia sp.]HNO41543.1 YbgC/FadM family acyl-CoA thioesterase [Ottowia sp.]HQO53437.1 YbgC/FadM family acyl-CoA thioesterase [Ottowia sp.]
MKPADFRFHHPLRVRWAEVDLQQIVFNPHYLTYYDCAMADYWRALALPYEATLRRLQGDIFLRKTSVEFNASAQLDDRLDVALRCERVGHSSITFTGAIFRDQRLLNTAELVYVFADPASQRSRAVPAPLRALFAAYEAGERLTDVQLGPWSQLAEPARAVRSAVFIEEQGIAHDEEWDALDADAVHAVVFNRLGVPVGTGRLLREPQAGTARIGRMAVDRALRGGGVGRLLIEALQQAAAGRGDRRVVLSAQRSAEGFYRRLGYAPVGQPYDEVGIPHIGMQRDLV